MSAAAGIPDSLSEDCQAAYDLVTNPTAQFVRCFLLFLLLSQFAVFVLLAAEFRRRCGGVLLHGNLKILYINLAIIYQCSPVGQSLAEIRNVLLALFARQSPCAMLTPLWYAAFCRVFTHTYTAVVPFLHLAIMLERVRATRRRANSYEWEGTAFGWLAAALSYVFGLGMVVGIFWVAISEYDYAWSTQLAINTIVVQRHPAVTPLFLGPLIGIVVVTAVGDLWLYLKNRALLEQTSMKNYGAVPVAKGGDHQQHEEQKKPAAAAVGAAVKYNLSEKYQLRENMVAMRLSLPLDFGNLLTVMLFNILQLLIRTFQTQLGPTRYYYCYNLDYCLITLYTIASLLYYWHFLVKQNEAEKGRRRQQMAAAGRNHCVVSCCFSSAAATKVAPAELEIGEIYFDQLNAQWNSMPKCVLVKN